MTSWICLLLLCLLLVASVANAGNTHRHHSQQKKRVVQDDDYEYRDVTDYSSGVFVDSVPISSTKKAAPAEGKTTTQAEFQNTNRYPKLRKFYDSNDEERRWYEAIFAQRK